MFHVGQKVVCVDDRFWALTSAFEIVTDDDTGGLTKGRIYTVRQVGLRAWTDGSPAIRLMEIIRGPDPGVGGSREEDTPYFARRFRPVTERKSSTSAQTDISVFTEMLTKAPNEMERVE